MKVESVLTNLLQTPQSTSRTSAVKEKEQAAQSGYKHAEAAVGNHDYRWPYIYADYSIADNNVLGLPRGEYLYFFALCELGDDDHSQIYFPPPDAPLEVQQDWYDKVKDLSFSEKDRLQSAIRNTLMYGEAMEGDWTKDSGMADIMRNRAKSLGYTGVLELSLKKEKRIYGVCQSEGFLSELDRIQWTIDKFIELIHSAQEKKFDSLMDAFAV